VLIAAGVDAAIVQSGEFAVYPNVVAGFSDSRSTQMTISSAAGVEFARELGCCLVVLARECPVEEIAKIAAGPAGMLPLECLCMGRCAWLIRANV